jgi:hypothetical protein
MVFIIPFCFMCFVLIYISKILCLFNSHPGRSSKSIIKGEKLLPDLWDQKIIWTIFVEHCKINVG